MARRILKHALTALRRARLPLNNLRVGSAYWALYSQLQDFESRCILALGVLSAIAAGVPLPLMAVVFRNIIETFPPPESQLNQAIHYLLAIASAYFALTWTWTVSWGIIGGRIARRLQESLVEKVVGLDMAFFDTETLDLTSILTADTQTIRRGTSEKVGLFIQSLSYFVATFVTGFILSPPLTGVLLAAVFPAMLILVSIGSTLVSKNSRKAGRYAEKASAAAEQAIKAVRVVQAFGAIEALGDSHARTLHHAAHYALRKSVCSAALLASIYFICYSTNSLAFFWGTELGGSSGTIYAVVFLILDASFVFTQVGPFIQTLAMASGAGEKVLKLLHRPNPNIDPYDERGHKVRDDDFDADIICHGLSFAYPVRKERMVLDRIHLNIKSGTSIGVVGLSGSGKSSLAGLLLRLYDPTSGHISIGGMSLKDLNTKVFRSKIALVDQEPVLFSASILDNVKAGILDCIHLSDEEVRSRCRRAISDANADFVWDLVGGIDYHVGDSGGGLSGGQRQRICLARALVRQPRLLILDEPTSALDSTSERKILDSLKTVASSGCTILMIAHRLSTIREMDMIVVMADGKIQEQGSHVELMDIPNGPYRLLVEAQQVQAEAAHDTNSGTASESLHDGGYCGIEDLDVRRPPHLTAGRSPVQLPGRVPGRAPGSVSGSILERATDLPARSRRPPSNSMSSQSEKTKQQNADQNEVSSFQLLKRCIKLNSRRENVILGIGLFASAVMGVLIVYEAIVFGHLVTLLQSNTNKDQILDDVRFYCLMFFVISLIALFASGISNACFGVVSENLLTKIREKSLRTVLKQDQEFFSVPEHSAHRLSAAITSDANHIAGLSGSIIATIFSVCVNLFAGVTVAIAFAWSIALVLLALLPAIVFAGYLRVSMLTRYEKRHHESFKHAAALASEAVQNIRTVAAYGHEAVILRHYKAAIQGPYRQDFWYCIFGDLALTLSYCIVFFTYSLAYWWGARQVRDGHFTELDFFTMLPAFLLTAQQAGQLFSAAPELLQARTAARRLFKLLDSRPTIIATSQDQKCAKEAEKSASTASVNSLSSDSQQTLDGAVDGLNGQAGCRQTTESSDAEKRASPLLESPSAVEEAVAAERTLNGSSVTFTGVSLTYPSNPAAAVLDDVTFDIPRGSTVGLVGPSGAGKSSLISLIERFYDPVSGGLAIDEVDIRQMPVEMHRARLSYVPQEPILFDGTVAFNVGLGLSNSTKHGSEIRAEVERLCRHYGLHDFIISLPEGYNTEVGAGGSQLSGGQRQRVAFARALVRRPRILILDEATSALDAHSEQEVQRILNQVKAEGRTVIIIAHRMASVKDADRIIVLDKGHVVEMGCHEELMRLGGVYSHMVNAQAVS